MPEREATAIRPQPGSSNAANRAGVIAETSYHSMSRSQNPADCAQGDLALGAFAQRQPARECGTGVG